MKLNEIDEYLQFQLRYIISNLSVDKHLIKFHIHQRRIRKCVKE
jgi:hypothetical protein